MQKIENGKFIVTADQTDIKVALTCALLFVVFAGVSQMVVGIRLFVMAGVLIVIAGFLLALMRVNAQLIFSPEGVVYTLSNAPHTHLRQYAWQDISAFVRYAEPGRTMARTPIRAYIRTKTGEEICIMPQYEFGFLKNEDKKTYAALKEYLAPFLVLESIPVSEDQQSMGKILLRQRRLVSEERIVSVKK